MPIAAIVVLVLLMIDGWRIHADAIEGPTPVLVLVVV